MTEVVAVLLTEQKRRKDADQVHWRIRSDRIMVTNSSTMSASRPIRAIRRSAACAVLRK